MKIYSMTATFGKLENQTLTFQPGLNVISAPNECGKSTGDSLDAHRILGRNGLPEKRSDKRIRLLKG